MKSNVGKMVFFRHEKRISRCEKDKHYLQPGTDTLISLKMKF